MKLLEHLLDEFVGLLNQQLAPGIALYRLEEQYHFVHKGEPQAWACSRDFEFAKLILLPEGALVRASLMNEEHRRRHPDRLLPYEDPQVFEQIAVRLRQLDGEIVTVGWSNEEIEEWEERQHRLMLATWPGGRPSRSTTSSLQSLLRSSKTRRRRSSSLPPRPSRPSPQS